MAHSQKRRKLPSFCLPQTLSDAILAAFDHHFKQRECFTSSLFANSYQREAFMSKYNGPGTTLAADRADAARRKWLAAEDRNATTNHRLFFDEAEIAGVSTDEVLNRAARYIRKLIGSVEEIRWDIFPTNGASTRIRKSGVAASLKFEGQAHATARAEPWWLSAIQDTILADEEGLVYPLIVNGSVMFTVPKNSEIDRVACKEPEVNQWLQRSVGVHLRERLLKVGINLLDQSRNRMLARQGSIDGELATIDLSSASDLISRTLVNRLLPVDWYCLLDDIRVHECRLLDGTNHELHMFSSMGNGFTFELETLIFWAICSSIQSCFGIRGVVSVYGDDIIVSTRTARLFKHFAAWFGFKVNPKKTFYTGRFRESCGGHYYGGRDVTPFYARKPLTHVSDVIRIANQFREWSIRLDDYQWALDYGLWQYLSNLVPKQFHGGKDIESSESLVTPGPVRNRLVRSESPLRRPEKGAYLLWHTTRGDEDYRVTSDPVRQSEWVVRRNRAWSVSIPLYSEEYTTE